MSYKQNAGKSLQNELFCADTVRERLRELRIGEHERLMAEAHLARAEAIAELLARAAAAVRGAARALLRRPWRRIAEASH